MTTWNDLPAEMRIQIMETLARDPSHVRTKVTRKRGLTDYALVCKEWQHVFEKANVGHLILNQSCLEEFLVLPNRFRPLVRHIWLRIELPEYDMRASENPEYPKDVEINNAIFDHAFRRLMGLLSSWEKAVRRNKQALTIELSLHSPSDTEYFFRGLQAKDTSRHPRTQTTGAIQLLKSSHCIPWTNEIRHRIEGSIMKLFGAYVHTNFRRELPRLENVRSFIIPRHTRRRLSSYTMFQILQCFPRLEFLDLEPWRQLWQAQQDIVDAGYVNLIKGSIPKGLKSLSLFEDSYRAMRDDFVVHLLSGEESTEREPNHLIASTLAKRSLELETLSASFLVEADDFFGASRPEWVWKHLRTLALTSRLFCSGQKLHRITDLLYSAGKVALEMEKLQTLEIWNGGKGHAGIFRYQAKSNHASIAWRGTWDLVFEPRVIAIWQKVAEKNYGNNVVVEPRKVLSEDDIRSYADVIDLLVLKRQVLQPGSLYELHEEAKHGLLYYP